MEIEKQVFTIFGSFIRDLSKTYPEIKSCLYRNYEYCLVDGEKKLSECPHLEKFLEIINEHEKFITHKNLEFFDLEIELLEEISFKKLWEKNITNKTRESIWKYLQTFQIININLKSNEELRQALSQIGTDTVMEVDKSTAKDLKKLKKLSEKVQDKNLNQGESELDEMLGGLLDSGIGDIAKEVAKNMNVDEMFGNINENSNPMEIMSQMMNPEKMNSIFQNINSVMEQKVESGELTQDSLKNEASKLLLTHSNNKKNIQNELEQISKDTKMKIEHLKSQNKQKMEHSIKAYENKMYKKIESTENLFIENIKAGLINEVTQSVKNILLQHHTNILNKSSLLDNSISKINLEK